ncbi:fimbrial protein [Lelliottia nimipressuralis]
MLKKIFILMLYLTSAVPHAQESTLFVSAWDTMAPQPGETFAMLNGHMWYTTDAQTSGINYMKLNRNLYQHERLQAGFENSYVPYSGMWKMRLRWCPAKSPQACTISQSAGYLDSGLLYVSSTAPVSSQDLRFTLTGITPADVAFCYTFVGGNGTEWSTSALRTCQDTYVLPEIPAACYINYNQNLNVALGMLERSKIPTTYNAGVPVTKTVPVMCSGDAAINVEMKVSYEAIAVSGSEVIKTPSNGLGVAMLYNGTPIGPGTPAISLTYQPGVSNLDLGFVAVRDPNVNLGDIPTGDFAASASLIMNQQ